MADAMDGYAVLYRRFAGLPAEGDDAHIVPTLGLLLRQARHETLRASAIERRVEQLRWRMRIVSYCGWRPALVKVATD